MFTSYELRFNANNQVQQKRRLSSVCDVTMMHYDVLRDPKVIL